MPVIRTVEDFETEVTYQTSEYEYVDAVVLNSPTRADKSWTISFSLKENGWVSWHSYIPNFYFHFQDAFFAWKTGLANFWRFNKEGLYAKYFGVKYPHILEFVLTSPIEAIWDEVDLITYAKSYNGTFRTFLEERNITFNKLIAYNSRQTTGLLSLIVKDTASTNSEYLVNQVTQTDNTVVIDKVGKAWHVSELRDIVIDYTEPLFKKDDASLSSTYFIDKILNTSMIDVAKDWYELESLRDKYLVLRFIIDNFENIKLTTDFSVPLKVPA